MFWGVPEGDQINKENALTIKKNGVSPSEDVALVGWPLATGSTRWEMQRTVSMAAGMCRTVVRCLCPESAAEDAEQPRMVISLDSRCAATSHLANHVAR